MKAPVLVEQDALGTFEEHPLGTTDRVAHRLVGCNAYSADERTDGGDPPLRDPLVLQCSQLRARSLQPEA